jgi:putative hydrolase of the HAD superfamily
MKNFIQNKRAIVFDLDNTLYDETDYFYNVLFIFCQKIDKTLYTKALIDLYEIIRPFSKDIFTDLLKGVDLYSDENKDELFNIYVNINVKEGIKIDKSALEFIIKLKKKNMKLGLLTNGILKAQKNKIKMLNISDYFDEIVYAREFGKDFEKPHNISFEAIANRLNESFNALIFIGDNPETDFKVPHERGAMTIRRRHGINSKKEGFSDIDFEFYDWNELIEKL